MPRKKRENLSKVCFYIDAKDIYCLHPLSGEAWLIGDSEKANKIGEEYYEKHGVKPIF